MIDPHEYAGYNICIFILLKYFSYSICLKTVYPTYIIYKQIYLTIDNGFTSFPL